MDVKRKIFTPPQQSYFLFGPRGTGKSTWLKAFGAEYPEAELMLVYGGKLKLKKQNILCVPIEAFLKEMF